MARKNSRPLVYLSSCVLSTMDVPAAVPLLKGAANFCGQRGGVLLGVDLRGRLAPSAPTESERARKLLETFNLNVLAHLHRRFAARFRPERFEHALMTNQALCRSELRLVSRTDQTLKIDGRKIRVARGESILTEARRRYCRQEIEQLTRDSGTTIERAWFSADQTLALFYLRPGC